MAERPSRFTLTKKRSGEIAGDIIADQIERDLKANEFVVKEQVQDILRVEGVKLPIGLPKG